MKSITICFAYYENAGMLDEQCRRFRKLPEALKQHLRLIIVDDGTGAPKAAPDGTLLRGVLPSSAKPVEYQDIGFPFDGYRMLVDIRWNQDSCRNLAVDRAQTDWVLLLDIDHIPPLQTLRALVEEELAPERSYGFPRYVMEACGRYRRYRRAPNLWFLTRETFWAAGGYDELLRGKYGSDRDVRDRLYDLCGDTIELPHPLYMVTPQMVSDANTSSYTRKDKNLDADLGDIIEKRNRTPNWQPMYFRTPWEKVF